MTSIVHATPLELTDCRLPELSQSVKCGAIERSLAQENPSSPALRIQVAVLPAKARLKKQDPLFLIAGGPGQSAIEMAAAFNQMLVRQRQRRDLVLVDLRGTGQSAPLSCAPLPASAPLSTQLDPDQNLQRIKACVVQWQKTPTSDLRYYNTTRAVQDLDAVRKALGYAQINLVGASYGTRVILEYLRLFPEHVRRVVMDGVAPASMALPLSAAEDAHTALQHLFQACERDRACAHHYPELRKQWRSLLRSLPVRAEVKHPVTAQPQGVLLKTDAVLGTVRTALYSPLTASALPQAIDQARKGHWEPLITLGLPSARPRTPSIYIGAHMGTICSEDMPIPEQKTDLATTDNVFVPALIRQYRELCKLFDPLPAPKGFYTLEARQVPALLLSGEIDPVTPPRHGRSVAQSLGPAAQHLEIANAGHGVLSLPCLGKTLSNFLDQGSPRIETPACARSNPRPPSFLMPYGTKESAHD